MLIKLIKSVNFKQAYTAKQLIHFTITFSVKLGLTVVLDESPKKVLASILLIESTKIINFSTLDVTKIANLSRHKSIGVRLSIKSRCEMQTTFGTLKNHIYFPSLLLFVLLPCQ